MRLAAMLILLPLAASATASLAVSEAAQPAPAAATAARIVYPQTARENVVEEQFGERVADPYRWLENDG
jgi:prolyl oligopeptidase